jgi:hypothetical protein
MAQSVFIRTFIARCKIGRGDSDFWKVKMGGFSGRKNPRQEPWRNQSVIQH